MYDMNTILPPAAQWRFKPPCVEGSDPRSVSGLFQSSRASPVVASAVHSAHGVCRCSRIGSGVPPAPGRRMKTIRFPSGDHFGVLSRFVVGAIQSTPDFAPENTPTKE